jgi:WD40 repeat protein/tRNA A-37 threonylcarbamoyl transferase component Bud32
VDRTRWIQIEEVLQQALDVAPEERAAFLKERCDGDTALLAHVEGLLNHEIEARSFMESPAVTHMLPQGSAGPPSQLGHYQVESSLGSGGMGDVFKARDEKLRRIVALKVLRLESTSDPQRIRRFEQEALAASRLNHPNIVTIFEITRAGEIDVIVEEFVDGTTLRALLRHPQTNRPRPLKLEHALDIAIQIARALKAAHTAWIIHRDIKPDNVMIREDGLVKVLDFGIAKLADELEPSIHENHNLVADTRANPLLTIPGAIMGTASYMSPEQARGEPLDGRTDLFSLGALLYEMVTGVQLFAGSKGTQVLQRLDQVDELVRSNLKLGHVPKGLQPILKRALKSKRGERYASAGEFLDHLTALKKQLENRATRRVVGLSALAVLIALTAAGVAAFLSVTETWNEHILRDGHTAAVRRAVFSPDGKLLVSVSEDHKVIVWDFIRRRRLKTLTGHTAAITTAAFSPDGKWFVTGGEDESVILWNTARLERERVWHDQAARVVTASFSPDSSLLAYATGPVLVIRETKTWSKLKEFPSVSISHGNYVFVDANQRLVDSHGDVWSVATGELVLDSPEDWGANWIAPSPDGKRWASIDSDGYLKVVDLFQQRSLFAQHAHHDHGRSIVYSPDGKLIATAAERVLLWDAATMTKITPFEYESIVWSVVFSPDGRWLVSTHGDGSILIWDVVNRELKANLREHSGAIRSIAFSSDGKHFATASDDRSVILWNSERQTIERVIAEHTTRAGAVTFAPDSRSLISSDQLGVLLRHEIAEDRTTIIARQTRAVASYCVAVSPDGQFVATSFFVYRIDSGEEVLRPSPAWHSVYSATFSPDGRLLIGVTDSGEVLVIDAKAWKLIERQQWTNLSLVSLSLSPDGNHIVTGDDGKTIRLGTIQPLRQLGVIGQHGARVKAVAFSPDGTQVASAGDDKMVALWDVKRRKLIATIGTHSSPVYALAFSPDGRRLLTGEHDRSVREYVRQRMLWGFALN